MKKIDWQHIYLLAWYDQVGKIYTTTYEGTLPIIGVILTGVNPINMPLWKTKVPSRAQLHEVPAGVDALGYAREINGYYAFGWYIENGFERES